MSYLRSAVVAVAGRRTYLGAWWVRVVLALSAPSWRPGLALRLLGLAPHYFHGRDLGAAAHRCRVSREMFVRDVLEPYLAPEQDLLDVSCGPGYLARAVSGRVWSVEAVDRSRGVLACARILSPATNIDYRAAREFFGSGCRVDIAVSLAAAERLDDSDLTELLRQIAASLRPAGRLVLSTRLTDADPDADPDAGPHQAPGEPSADPTHPPDRPGWAAATLPSAPLPAGRAAPGHAGGGRRLHPGHAARPARAHPRLRRLRAGRELPAGRRQRRGSGRGRGGVGIGPGSGGRGAGAEPRGTGA